MNPSSPRRIALAGASGLIGRELVARLVADPACSQLHLVLRRPLPQFDSMPRVQVHRLADGAMPPLPPVDDAVCALGTTIKTAGSQAAFRAVDFDAVVAFAQRARAAGAHRLAVVSALGASPKSGNFYSRVKGEMETAVSGLGFECVVIARPSLLAGDRAALGQPVRFGERLALAVTGPLGALIPKALRPIKAGTVARGMLVALQQARHGVRIVESAELQELGA
jgi:uncharacterized protein YbjT (DUF2867 family)